MIIPLTPTRRAIAFTIPELLVASGLGGIIIAALAVSLVFCTRSFLAMGNYMELNKSSLNCIDRISRDIREARSLQSFNSNRLVFLDFNSNQMTFTWDMNTKQLTRTQSGTNSVLLKNCDYLAFNISQRSPTNGVFGFYPATNNAAICKLVDVSWRCYRTIYGHKINTESVQTAKIVLRN
jgi:hypothetical protein